MSNSLPSMTFPQINPILSALWSTPNPNTLVMLGAPGVAKTSYARQTAREILSAIKNVPLESVGYLEFLAGGRDTTDITGLGLPAKAPDGTWRTMNTRPAIICAIDDALTKPGIDYLVLNVDEITQCDRGMTKALRSVIDADTRTAGGYPIPDSVYIIATGNRLKDKADSGRMLSHAANAVFRVEVTFDFDSWADWAATQPIHPLAVAVAGLCDTDGGFFADSVPIEDVQYCTARSFTRFAVPLTALAGGVDAKSLPIDRLTRQLAAASIGEGPAEHFFNTLQMVGNVPTGADIQADPENALLSSETQFQHAASQIALRSAVDNVSADRAIRYISRLRNDLQISAGAALINKALKGPEPFRLSGDATNTFIERHHESLPLAEGVEL